MRGWGVVSDQEWRRGPWTPEEDKLLTEYVTSHGEGRWSSVATCAGLNRSGKSCRLRWVNYLRPGLKRGRITPQEEGIIIELHALWGNKWSTIAGYLPGRTDNEIKNYWRTHFKKKGKPSDKQEKIKFHRQKNQRQENQMPEANISVSPPSDVTSDRKMMSEPQADQQEKLSTYPGMDQNQCFPAMHHDVSAWSSDTIPLDGLWGWLWNLDDQNGLGGQTGDSGKMAFQNQANVYNGGYIF